MRETRKSGSVGAPGWQRPGATRSWAGDERKRDGARDVERREARKRKRECEHDRWSEINSRLLRAMGGSGRWIPDTLIEASGLSASEVNSALTLLQLSGRIRRRADAFEPV
jgi:DprA winged helix domain